MIGDLWFGLDEKWVYWEGEMGGRGGKVGGEGKLACGWLEDLNR